MGEKYQFLLLDLDGVIADLHRPLLKLLGAKHTYEDITYWNFFDDKYPNWREVTADPNFWANLPYTPEARELITGLQDIAGHPDHIIICTAPTGAKGCIDGKIEWVNRNLWKTAARDMLLTFSKRVAAKGNVLVDDSDDNCNKFIKAGGKACLVAAPWNQRRGWRKNGTYNVQTLLDEVRAAWTV